MNITFYTIDLPGGATIDIAHHPVLPDLVLNRATRRAIRKGRWVQL